MRLVEVAAQENRMVRAPQALRQVLSVDCGIFQHDEVGRLECAERGRLGERRRLQKLSVWVARLEELP